MKKKIDYRISPEMKTLISVFEKSGYKTKVEHGEILSSVYQERKYIYKHFKAYITKIIIFDKYDKSKEIAKLMFSPNGNPISELKFNSRYCEWTGD